MCLSEAAQHLNVTQLKSTCPALRHVPKFLVVLDSACSDSHAVPWLLPLIAVVATMHVYVCSNAYICVQCRCCGSGLLWCLDATLVLQRLCWPSWPGSYQIGKDSAGKHFQAMQVLNQFLWTIVLWAIVIRCGWQYPVASIHLVASALFLVDSGVLSAGC
jgi:hypothetical protein